jgi:predicted CopG family antitoxin
MSDASKRIPVTEQRVTELNELKRAGESYDELLRRLIRERHRRTLSERTREVRESGRDELTALCEV